MKFSSAVCGKACPVLIGLFVATGIAGQAVADPVGAARVVRVKSTDTVIIEDGDRIIYIASPRNRHGSGGAKADPKKRVAYEGIGTEEAIRRHNEVVGQLMDGPSQPVECR
jgi:hypothetical protein